MTHPQHQQEVQWRSLFPARSVASTTYRRDLVGEIPRFDERDCMFARIDLQPGSDRYQAYYLEHEEFQAADDFMRGMPPLGSSAAPSDAAAMAALFSTTLDVGRQPDGGTIPPIAGARVALDPHEASTKVKSLALLLGADQVGVGPLDPAHVYSHVGRTFYGQNWGQPIVLDHPWAISLGVAMDFNLLQKYAPGFPVILESGLAYAKAAVMALQLAGYIQSLGYSARAHHLRDYQILSVPVAIDAGMGEMGRHGVLISWGYGSALRLATVTTDMPLAPDLPVDMGIQDYCSSCRLCAMACPAGAIPTGDKLPVRGIKRWKLAAGRCYHYWREVGSDCALCLVACPWSRPDDLTRHLRPIHPELRLEEATVARARDLRAALPAWQRKLMGV